MTILVFVLPAIVAALMAFALTPYTRRLAFAVGAVDQPGPRKIHKQPTPRLGGLAVIASMVTVTAIIYATSPHGAHILPDSLLRAVAISLVPIVAISLLDDMKSQRAILKFAVHIGAASIAVLMGVRLNAAVHLFGREVYIGWFAIPISILWLAAITNAFNLVDGLDGLSAGLALISTVSLVAVSIVMRRYEMAAMAAILAGALTGFLPFNTYPAKVYLGDSGATAIGFILGALTLGGGSTTTAGLAVVLPVVVLGLPLAETIVSMMRRLIRRIEGNRNNVFSADRNHIHHRLLAIGLDHKRAVLTLYLVGVALALAGFASVFLKEREVAWLLAGLAAAAIVGLAQLDYDEFAMIRRGVVLQVYNAPVLKKGFFAVFVDLMFVAIALYATTVLKYDDWAVRRYREELLGLVTILPPITIATFALLRIYKRAWSTAGVEDLVRSSAAVITSSGVALIASKVLLSSAPRVTFVATYTLVMLLLVNGSRASYRVLYHWNRKSNRDGEPVLIYGAGRGGVLALREILSNSAIVMRPVGFVDDDLAKHGRDVHGYPILGGVSSLGEIVARCQARGVIVASEKIPIRNLESARVACEARGAWVRRFTVDFRVIEDEGAA